MATECSQNDESKTQYYIVILDRLQGCSRALERAPESWIRGPLIVINEVQITKQHQEHNRGRQENILEKSSNENMSSLIGRTW